MFLKEKLLPKNCILAREESVNMSIYLQKKFGSGFFGKEGVFNIKVTGPSHIWVQTMPKNKLLSLIPRDNG